MSHVDATGRTSTKRKLRGAKIEPPFVQLRIEMKESPAFRALILSERRILDRLEIEDGHHSGKENGNLICTYKNFEEYGIRTQSIAPSIRVLCKLGFLEVTDPGRAGNGEHRRAARYRLTYLHTRGPGDRAIKTTDEWRKFETIEAAKEIATATRAAPSKIKKPLRKTVVKPHYKSVANRAITAPQNGITGPTTKTASLSIFPPLSDKYCRAESARLEREQAEARLHGVMNNPKRLSILRDYACCELILSSSKQNDIEEFGVVDWNGCNTAP
jgi:hypothetical protein